MATEAQQKSLELAIKQIDKAFGKGSLIRLGDKEVQKIDFIPTGSLGLDLALGIGGIPRGRVIEIYGPESSGKTTLTLHAIAEAQKADGVCAFIDAEHALDVKYAKQIGVDVDNLLLAQPDSGEDALEMVETLIRSGACDLIVVDSVAALTPKAEIDGDMDSQQVGVQARLMSKALRKITSLLNKTQTTIIFINQIRMKIGMTGYGCFHYDTLVNFTDGRSLPIGKVVDERIEGSVYTINEETGKIEEKEIVGWQDNGKITDINEFLHIETASIDGSGRFGFTCTRNHEILTNSGWKKAEDILISDKLISKYNSIINGTLKNFLAGVFTGDSLLQIRDFNTANLILQDSENRDYLEWKIQKLTPFFNFKESTDNRFKSNFTYELAKLKKEIIKDRRVQYLVDNFDNLAMAIFYMDDGYFDNSKGHSRMNISLGRFKNEYEEIEKLRKRISEFYKIDLSEISIQERGVLKFTKKATDIVQNSIKCYIPESMQYKLANQFQGFYEDFELSNVEEILTDVVDIKLIRDCSNRQFRNKRKFDLTIDGNHNYMVGGINNGVIVHNSPETTPGGNALKFYSSVRMDIRRISTLKNGDNSIGNRVRVKIAKNKVSAPFKQAEFDIMFGKGISKSGEIIDYGIKYDVVDKAGAWFSYGDMKLGQGREKAKELIESNPTIMKEIEAKVLEKFNPDELMGSFDGEVE